jgi:uncharacterized protein (TIGR02679 family)
MSGSDREMSGSDGPEPSLDRYRGQEYRRLLAAARRSLERTGGQLTGRISVADPDDAERKAIIGITGVHQPAGTRRMTVPLAELDAALSRAAGLSLAGVLAALGEPVRNRPAETARLAGARTGLIAVAQDSLLAGSCPWYHTWLTDLTRDGTITRLANTGDAVTLAQAVRTLEFLADRPVDAPPIALPALAARITGDTKALNHGSTLATLILRALALREGLARPAAAAQRRELWDLSGVIVDDLASRVLVLNLPAQGDGLAEWLTGAARYGTPFQVTLQQLDAHPIRLAPARIFGCENPAVLRRACAELGPACPPLLCAEGQPSTAFHKLVRLAVTAGSELAYHGDFDWPGIAITAKVIDRHGARPWRMTAADYLSGVKAGDTAVALKGDPVPTPWEPGLRETMHATGRAIYEETVADQLLADLRQAYG